MMLELKEGNFLHNMQRTTCILKFLFSALLNLEFFVNVYIEYIH